MMVEKKTKMELLDPAVETLLSLIVEDLKEHHNHQLEPYEVYVDRLKLELYGDYRTFLNRFKRGHQALLDELKAEEHG